MVARLIERLRSLDLLRTELECDDWCTQTNSILQEVADFLEDVHKALLKNEIKPKKTLN